MKSSSIKVIDTFIFNDELDLLECRLVELYDSVDFFIIVESEIDHHGNKKSLHYQENKNRYSSFSDKIININAIDMPTFKENNNPWSREWAQRENIAAGLNKIDYCDDDIVLQSDVDEIPTASLVKNINTNDILVFEQRLHGFAIDWEHPDKWYGTVAAPIKSICKYTYSPFTQMRDARFPTSLTNKLINGGHHFTWLGGQFAQAKKAQSYPHLELLDQKFLTRVIENEFYNLGTYINGTQQVPCEIDETYPKWILEGNAPKEWYRPKIF